jgi:hypothetical protein
MNDLAIKIRIADRDYPMRVAVADEERLRLAGRQLSEQLREYREKYGIQDKQDLESQQRKGWNRCSPHRAPSAPRRTAFWRGAGCLRAPE